MFTRISSPLMCGMAIMLLSGCGQSEGGNDPFKVAASGDDAITCAVDGAAAFEPTCSIERTTSETGLLLTIRHPSGGFRRLLVTTDGRGVVTADGAETAVVTPIGTGTIEVVIGADKYRLPATIKGTKAATP